MVIGSGSGGGFYRYPHYNTTLDTPDKVDYDKMAYVVDGLEMMPQELSGARE